MKKLDSLRLTSVEILTHSEMKNLKGGFDCGNGLTYYDGTCPNGSGYSVCATSADEASGWGSGFCGGYGH